MAEHAFKVNLSGNQTITGSGTNKILFNVVEYDTDSEWNTGNYSFKPTVSGYYQFNVTSWCITSLGLSCPVEIDNQGTQIVASDAADPTSGNIFTSASVIEFIDASLNEEVTVSIKKGDNSISATEIGTPEFTTFSGHLISTGGGTGSTTINQVIHTPDIAGPLIVLALLIITTICILWQTGRE